MNWEQVCPGIIRIAVPGGWIYRTQGADSTCCFVPDPKPLERIATALEQLAFIHGGVEQRGTR